MIGVVEKLEEIKEILNNAVNHHDRAMLHLGVEKVEELIDEIKKQS